MLAFGHITIALLATKIFMQKAGIVDTLFVILMSILPDIDHPNSWLGQIRPISYFLYSKFGHRTFTHSLIFAVLVTNFFAFDMHKYVLAWIGIGTHLFADMLTYTGIPIFWPYNVNFVILGGKLKTGSLQETMISVLSGIGVVILCVWI